MVAEIRVDLNENETDTMNANKEPDQDDQVIPESFYWAETKGSDFTKMVDDIYGCIVFFRRNLFNLSSGGAGKDLTNSWTERAHFIPTR